MALSAPFPATCGMVAPSATAGEEEEEEREEGLENGNADPKSGCWIFVAGVREQPPPPLDSSSFPRGSVQGGSSGPAAGEGKVRGGRFRRGKKKLVFFFFFLFFCLG